MKRERLPKTLIVTGTWGIVALSTLVAIKNLLPSYNLISDRENQKLVVAANSQAYAVKQFLQLSQVSSQQIVNYVTKNSELSSTKHQKRKEPKLFTKNGVLEFGNYLNRSIVGISYFNTNGELVSKAGRRVPQDIKVSKPSDQVNHQFIKLASEVYLMITTPVGKKQNIGQVVILVNLKDLKYSLTKFNEIYQTDNTILLSNDSPIGKNAKVFTFSEKITQVKVY